MNEIAAGQIKTIKAMSKEYMDKARDNGRNTGLIEACREVNRKRKAKLTACQHLLDQMDLYQGSEFSNALIRLHRLEASVEALTEVQNELESRLTTW